MNLRMPADEPTMFAVYLMPPPRHVLALSLAHATLEREYGCVVAGSFMAHVTIKGFTRSVPGIDFERLVGDLDNYLSAAASFPVRLRSPILAPSARGMNVIMDLEKTDGLMALQREIWRIVEPYVSPDCPFTQAERPAEVFRPHLTLAQYDFPVDPGIQAQAMAVCQAIWEDLPSRDFEGRDMQLIRFESDAWEAEWWKTLRFRQEKGWQLTSAPAEKGSSVS